MFIMGAVAFAAILFVAVYVKRVRGRKEIERHSISPDDLHALLASGGEVALFDVRLPLDLLSNSVIIPGAQRLAPAEVIANPALIPGDRDAVVYCTCPSDATSRSVLVRARAKGIRRIRFLRGGLDGWKSRGYPVVPYDKPFHLGPRADDPAVAS